MLRTSPSAGPGRAALRAAVTVATLWLAGCTALQPKTPEEEVAARAQQRWAHIIKGDMRATYDYTQPGFRAVVSREDYLNRFGEAVRWKRTELEKVTCEAERCSVRVRVTSQNLAPQFARQIPEISAYLSEQWVRDEGRWWFYEAP